MKALKTCLVVLFLSFSVTGCSIFGGGSLTNVEGYGQLEQNLSPTEIARKDLLDTAGDYLLIQEVLKQAKLNPQVGDDFKTAIVEVNDQMAAALTDYRTNLSAGPDVLTAKLQTLLQILERANLLMVQYASTAAQGVLPNDNRGNSLLKLARDRLAVGDRKGYNDAMDLYHTWLIDQGEKG